MAGDIARLLAFVLPLGLDSFAVAAAIGAVGVSRGERIRISATFVVFEGGMPLIGFLVGAPLAHLFGGIAGYLAVAVLLAIGVWMLIHHGGDDEQARRLLKAKGVAMFGLGLSISLDELAIGFSIGLARLPVVAVSVAIALQALVASQLGLALGTRIGERLREGAERLAGAVLVGLALFLLVEHLLGR